MGAKKKPQKHARGTSQPQRITTLVFPHSKPARLTPPPTLPVRMHQDASRPNHVPTGHPFRSTKAPRQALDQRILSLLSDRLTNRQRHAAKLTPNDADLMEEQSQRQTGWVASLACRRAAFAWAFLWPQALADHFSSPTPMENKQHLISPVLPSPIMP